MTDMTLESLLALADTQMSTPYGNPSVWGSAPNRLTYRNPMMLTERAASAAEVERLTIASSTQFSAGKGDWGVSPAPAQPPPTFAAPVSSSSPVIPSPPSAIAPIAPPPNTSSTTATRSGTRTSGEVQDICRQLASLSFTSQEENPDAAHSFSGGGDGNGIRLRARTALPSWSMDENGNIELNIAQIISSGLLQTFARDRLGCQHLQTNYPEIHTDERHAIVKEILENPVNFANLASDVFGNFFIQQIITNSTAIEQRWIAVRLKHNMFQFCVNRYSCRVVQKALDKLTHELQASLVHELHNNSNIVRLCVDQNGNHVVQKIMNSFPVNVWGFVIENFIRDEENLFLTAENKYGCRIVQLAVERLSTVRRSRQSEHLLRALMSLVSTHCMRLTLNEFSNYVIQYVIGSPALGIYRDAIIHNCLLSNLLSMSQEKYASHVIEKAMQHAPPNLLHEMMNEIFEGYVPHPETHRDALDIMMFHQFGNYIIQRMLSICVEAVRTWSKGIDLDDMDQRLTWLRRLSERITLNEAKLHKYSSGKKIIDMLAQIPIILRNADPGRQELFRNRLTTAHPGKPLKTSDEHDNVFI